MTYSILLVDDEAAILRAFQRAMRDPDWDIFLAQDGLEALAILAKQKIDIIISDMRMPKMNGYQLLQQVKVLYPATTRLVLSGFSEERESSGRCWMAHVNYIS
jgi:YesN/AraC family two-component response regulator